MRALAERLEHFLKKLFPTRVSFDDGSYIEFLNREAILYVEESGHRMEVVWYFPRGRMKGRVLHAADIDHWDSPHEAENLSPQKTEEIQRKIVEYCQKRSIPLEIK